MDLSSRGGVAGEIFEIEMLFPDDRECVTPAWFQPENMPRLMPTLEAGWDFAGMTTNSSPPSVVIWGPAYLPSAFWMPAMFTRA
jgi:hypothetical protein